MPKITWVSADYEDTLPFFGVVLIVHLDNTQTLFFSLEPKAGNPEYARLRNSKRIFDVKTDGGSVYWPGGPRLTLDEILAMLHDNGTEDNQTAAY